MQKKHSAISDRQFNTAIGGSKWKRTFSYFKRDKFLVLLCLPGILNYIIWHYLPMYGVLMAFKKFSFRNTSFLGIINSPWAENLGLSHIIRFFNDPFFERIIRNTIIINLLYLLIIPLPGILFALCLNEVSIKWFKGIVQTVSYFPYFLSSVVVVGIMVLALSPSTGFVNHFLELLGLEPIYFLMKPEWFRTVLMGTVVWQIIGWDTIIWLARISSIDIQQYESAIIDGASRIKRMLHITLPSFKEWYFINLIIAVGNLFASSGFEKIFLLYNPGTYETADIIGTYLYRAGLVGGEYSYATAVGLLNTVANLLLLVIANALSKKLFDESIW